MRSHKKPLIGNFPVRGFVVYGGWRLRDWETGRSEDISAFFLPPSFGRRCPEGAEVGRVKRYSHIQGSQPRLASLVCPFQRKGRE